MLGVLMLEVLTPGASALNVPGVPMLDVLTVLMGNSASSRHRKWPSTHDRTRFAYSRRQANPAE
jgi:hypothetical protein